MLPQFGKGASYQLCCLNLEKEHVINFVYHSNNHSDVLVFSFEIGHRCLFLYLNAANIRQSPLNLLLSMTAQLRS